MIRLSLRSLTTFEAIVSYSDKSKVSVEFDLVINQIEVESPVVGKFVEDPKGLNRVCTVFLYRGFKDMRLKS